MRRIALAIFTFAIAGTLGTPLSAQDREVPYWASLRAKEVNMRVGPSEDRPIEWVFRRVNLPIKVLRVHEGWRWVEDPDGARGWIVARLLSRKRTALVIGDGLAAIRAAPADGAALFWNMEPGVVGMLGDCESGWCEFDVEGRSGWVRQERLWGAGEP